MVAPTPSPITGSILKCLRQLLVVDSEDKSFDIDLLIFGNGALSIMSQLGVGPADGFRINDESETWADFIGNRTDLDLIQTDVYLRMRLVFDPPQNSFLVKGIQDQIAEYDWRIEAWHKKPHDIEQVTGV
ncbi:MAG: hypothetical protein RSC06_11055 [Clostridia bacterium]